MGEALLPPCEMLYPRQPSSKVYKLYHSDDFQKELCQPGLLGKLLSVPLYQW